MWAKVESGARTRANIQIILGLGLLITCEFLMFQGKEPFSSWFYPFVWWSYILIVDGVIYRLQGNSLIISRPREFLVMIPWSVTIWLFFEIANLRIENWYYANVIDPQSLRWSGYFVSYATVLPGIFETTELLCCLGLYSKVKTRIRVIPNFWFPISYLTGVIFILLPLFFPRYCFPLIWGGFIFLLEPINYLHGSPSFLREWEQGRPRTFLLLLTAGLVCGLLWEFWNYWAHSKWIYTVPFFDELKIFEMPVAGFLGFPPFALECYVMYNFIALFRSHRNWDKHNYLQPSSPRLSKKLALVLPMLAVFFYALAFHLIDSYTVNSYSATVAKMPWLRKRDIAVFHQMGVYSVSEFLDACSKESDQKDLQNRLALREGRLQKFIERAQLIKLKWMGVENFLILQKAGITTVKELSRQTPSNLHARLGSINKSETKTPTENMVKIWIRAAQNLRGE